jgi:hypothetical protein
VSKKVLWICGVLVGTFLVVHTLYFNYYIPYFDKNKLGIVDQNGKRIRFPETPYILCYIQSWCRDCIAETPCLVDFSSKNAIPIYFVTDEDTILMKRYRARFDFELPLFYSKEKFKNHGIYLYPTVYFYGKNQKLLYHKMERIDSLELAKYYQMLHKN